MPGGLLTWAVPKALLLGEEGRAAAKQRVNSPSLSADGRKYQACIIFPDGDGGALLWALLLAAEWLCTPATCECRPELRLTTPGMAAGPQAARYRGSTEVRVLQRLVSSAIPRTHAAWWSVACARCAQHGESCWCSVLLLSICVSAGHDSVHIGADSRTTPCAQQGTPNCCLSCADTTVHASCWRKGAMS